MELMVRYLRPHGRRMLGGLAFKIVGALLGLIIPYMLSYIFDKVVPRENIGEIFLWGGVMLLCAAGDLTFNVIANRMAAKVAMLSSENIRNDLFKKILYLSSEQTDKFTVPSLESRLTSDTYNVHSFIGSIQRIGVRAPILLIGGVIMTIILDVRLALIMIAILPFIAISVYAVSRRGIPLYTNTQKSVDGMVRIVREDAQGIRVIKALSKKDYEKERFNKANLLLSENEQRAGIVMARTNPSVTLLLNIGLVGVILLGAYFVSVGGEEQLGKIMAFMQYFTIISMGMMNVTRIFVMYTKGAASASRIDEVLQAEPDLAVIESDEAPKAGGAHIEFEDVSFSYKGVADNLSNISFTLGHGETLGIIGATGSGKTTLIRLLMRLYDADSGVVRIDGRDVRTIDPSKLHSMFGVVFQHDFLYADTIAENIRFGRDIGAEEIEAAAKTAQAHAFISDFADGYSHELATGGTNVSGGQKQRLLLARAMAAKPSILVLDDSSSALDYKTDAALRQAIKQDLPNTTTVVVAQRVSSVRSCDKIIVIDNGKITGIGDHDHLMATCEEYAEISRSQMGGAILE